jgi:hypothetical protein
MEEEIRRIQDLLRRMDQELAGENITLKDLAQAVRTAGDGGRSIAHLRKMARQLDTAGFDEETEQLRTQLLDMLDRLGGGKTDSAPETPPG